VGAATVYSDSERVHDARRRYFSDNAFGDDGGYGSSWVKLKLGPIPFGLPNTAARKRAVPLHDLHHVATGYATDWTGEGEISAWEIASNCRHHTAAWLLNLGAFSFGLVIAPRRAYRAFIRGRHSDNLYRGEFGEGLLALSVGELRARLRLATNEPTATLGDRVAFAFSALVATLWGASLPAAIAVFLGVLLA